MKQISYINSQKKSPLMPVLFGLAAVGITLGALYQTIKSPEPSFWIHQYFAPVYSGTDLFGYMCRSFWTAALFLAAAFLSGFSAVGQPFGILLIISRGFGVGASAATMYVLHGGTAVAGILVFVLPKAVVSLFICGLAIREALRASTYTLSGWLPEGFREYGKMDIRLYCVKFLVLIIISLIISVGDAMLNFMLAG